MHKTIQVQLFLAVLILGFLTGPRVIEAIQRLSPETSKPAMDEAAVGASVEDRPQGVAPNPYEHLPLHAQSVYVWDISTQRKLYSANGNARLPLASVAKIMTALVATESSPPKTQITITPSDILGEGDTGLYVGETWTLEKLLQFTLVASSNDGASAVAATLGAHMNASTSTDRDLNKKQFIEKMNEKARAIGLTQTSFQNESGLDVGSNESGAYGSARDMAMLFAYIFHKYPEIFTATAYPELDLRSESNTLHRVANTNQDVEHISGIIGSKTGYTDLAGGNLVVVVDIGIGHPVVIAVLGSTREDRFADARQLIAATTAMITEQPL